MSGKAPSAIAQKYAAAFLISCACAVPIAREARAADLRIPVSKTYKSEVPTRKLEHRQQLFEEFLLWLRGRELR